MKYIVHVVEEISIHKKNNISNEYEIQKCKIDDDSYAHILFTDAFYTVQSDQPINAVIEIANVIRTEDSDGDKVKLALILSEQNDSKSSDDINNRDLVNYIHQYKIKDKMNSNFFSSFYKIKKKTDKDSIIELHKISFYVIKENKIMSLLEK